MRVEDLDAPRTRPEAVLGNLSELAWLGLDWDEGPDVGGPYAPYLQSRRTPLYEEALGRLRDAGMVYECYLSRKEIAEVAARAGAESVGPGRSAASGSAATGVGAVSEAAGVDGAGEGPSAGTPRVYGPAHRELNERVAEDRRAAGRRPSLRFRVREGELAFDDAVQGRVRVDLASEVGDFVVRRSDGLVAYQLAVVVDDAAMGVTEVARGADLLASTAAQVLLFEALGAPSPTFAHVGLLLGDDGEKLAKRGGSLSLHELRVAGADPRHVLATLSETLRWTEGRASLTPQELLAELGPGQVTAPPEVATVSAADLAALTGVDS